MASSLALMALGLLASPVWAQVTCDGNSIPQASQLAGYPPTFQIASIVRGDTEAQRLFQAILNSGNPALNYTPSSAPGGVLSTAGYNSGADPHCWWSASSCKTPKVAGLLDDYYFCPQASTWGLTFDDGPTCYHNDLYNFLARQNQLATLYYIGTNVMQWPTEAQKGYLAGHEICVHTWSHHYTTSLTNEQVFAELYYTKKIIKQTTGASVRCWRPPYGDLDDRVRAIASALDMRAHLWDRDTFDWSMDSGASAATIAGNYRNIINQDHSSSGVVVLSHEVSTATCNMAIQQYPNVAAAFDHIVPVSTCNNDPVIMGESDQPALPVFSQYVGGARGGNRTAGDFWNDGDVVFAGNGTLALLENGGATTQSSPPPTTTSQTQTQTTGSPTTGVPSIVISPNNRAQITSSSSSGALSASALSLSTLLCLVGLLSASL